MSERPPCQACGSPKVEQIRTSKRNVEIAVKGARIRFVRLYLERCGSCGHIAMYGKTCLGPFNKMYIPAAAFAEGR